MKETFRKLKPIEFISLLRDSDKYIETIYMNGGCYQFFLILKKIYPEAELYRDRDHAVAKINNVFYDITGIASGDFVKADIKDLLELESWSFSRSNKLLILECPFCEEPISI